MNDDIEISFEELADMPEGTYMLIDIRDEASFEYSTMQGAVNMPDILDRAVNQVSAQKMMEERFGKDFQERLSGNFSIENADSGQNFSFTEHPDREMRVVEADPAQASGADISDPGPAALVKTSRLLPYDRKLVLLCMHGTQSLPIALELRRLGFDACSLRGGFAAWIMADMDDTDRSEEIDDSIRKNKHFHKRLFSKFAKACKEYELVQAGDRIAVCISGGKDSMLMAKLFQELKRHNKVPFELTFLVMDPGYNEVNRTLIEHNARTIGIPVKIFETRIFDAVYNIDKHPCYMCARMRRGHLYAKAKELGCNKIALGHHYDDVIETILMGMLYGSQIQTMMPKLHSEHFEGMELIRPMYLIREQDIKDWRDYNGLHFIQCACHFTDTCSSCRPDGTSASKRMEIKHLIRDLKKTNPYVEGNIFKSVENVNLKTIMAYKKDGVKHFFLENY